MKTYAHSLTHTHTPWTSIEAQPCALLSLPRVFNCPRRITVTSKSWRQFAQHFYRRRRKTMGGREQDQTQAISAHHCDGGRDEAPFGGATADRPAGPPGRDYFCPSIDGCFCTVCPPSSSSIFVPPALRAARLRLSSGPSVTCWVNLGHI